MTDTTQPEALRLADSIDQAACIDYYVEFQTTLRNSAEELRRLHAELETLRSILIRCRNFIDTTKVPAYPAGADLADEIDVLLAAQPAGAQQPGAAYAAVTDERAAFEEMMRSQTFDSLKRLSDGSYESYEARVGWMAWNVRASHGQAPAGATLGSDAIYELIHGFGHTTHAQSMEIALGISNLSPPSTTPQAAPQQEAQEPVAVIGADFTIFWAGHGPIAPIVERHALKVGSPLYAAPQPSPAAPAEGDALDAARYRLVRRGQHWSVINGIGNGLRGEELDAAVDAARKQGANHDN